jgi:hypothetical protein
MLAVDPYAPVGNATLLGDAVRRTVVVARAVLRRIVTTRKEEDLEQAEVPAAFNSVVFQP